MSARAPFQFGISTLLLVATVSAVACSVWKLSPPAGGVMTVAICAGLIGLTWRSLYAAKSGERLDGEQKLLAFLNGVWIAGTVGMILVFAAVVLFCCLISF
jgi:hypothetical protein